MRVVRTREADSKLDELIAASRQARAEAANAIAHSRHMQELTAALASRSLARRLESRAHRRFASILGTIEGGSVRAVVLDDGEVVADGALLHRAGLVVEMGDTFADGTIASRLSADRVASTLTLMRACDRVVSFEVKLPQLRQ